MDKALKKEVPNNELLPQVGALLGEGMEVTMSVKGYSMLPFIVGGRDSVVLKSLGGRAPELLDIVLARTSTGQYVVHRVIWVEGGGVTLMGDGNVRGTETCTVPDILGKVVGIDYGGRRYDPDTRFMRLCARVWIYLKPVRRYILAVWKRCFLRYR
ncbi:MAG: S24/S26 family peptidase [Candidatus Cryptobacteroides sp.]